MSTRHIYVSPTTPKPCYMELQTFANILIFCLPDRVSWPVFQQWFVLLPPYLLCQSAPGERGDPDQPSCFGEKLTRYCKLLRLSARPVSAYHPPPHSLSLRNTNLRSAHIFTWQCGDTFRQYSLSQLSVVRSEQVRTFFLYWISGSQIWGPLYLSYLP